MAEVPAAAPRLAPARPPGTAAVLAGQVRYQLVLLMRTPRALIAGLIMPGMLLALRLGRVSHATGHGTALPLAAYVGGLAAFGTLSIAYMTHASGLVAAREDGVLRRWRAAPLPACGYFAGRIAAAVLLADASGMVLVLAGVAMAGIHVTGSMIAGLLLATTLAALSLASAGTAITIVIPAAASANPVLMITYLPLIVFSGALGPSSGLPDWLTTLMGYLPARPLIDTATRILQHTAGLVLMSGRDLAVLAAWAAAGLLVSVRFFRWDPHRPAHSRRAPQPPRPGVVARRAP